MKPSLILLYAVSFIMVTVSFFGLMVGVLHLDPKAEYNLFRDAISVNLSYALSDHYKIMSFLSEGVLLGVLGLVVSTSGALVEYKKDTLPVELEPAEDLPPIIISHPPRVYYKRPQEPICAPVSKVHKKKTWSKSGWVYLLRAPDGLYKIGHTNDPNDRIRTFNVKLPFQVDYEYLIKCKNRFETEKRLHEHFSKKRVNGEWFSLDSEDVTYIKLKYPIDVEEDKIQ